MCEDIAKIVRKYNPKAKIYATNQELNNAGDRAIFDDFNQNPDSQLDGLYYGPGSNAMSWNGTKRPDHRLDLFEYPAFGVTDRYVRELVHNMSDRQELTFFTDITHWIASQYGFLVTWPMADFRGDMPPPLEFEVYNASQTGRSCRSSTGERSTCGHARTTGSSWRRNGMERAT